MKTRLVRIGNSRGLRLAKPPIQQLGFEDEVDMRAEGGALVIRASRVVRAGWADAAAQLAATGARPRPIQGLSTLARMSLSA